MSVTSALTGTHKGLLISWRGLAVLSSLRGRWAGVPDMLSQTGDLILRNEIIPPQITCGLRTKVI